MAAVKGKHRFVFKVGPLLRGSVATMDGQPIKGLRRAQVIMDANEVTIVRLDLIPEDVEIVADADMLPGWGDENPGGIIVDIRKPNP